MKELSKELKSTLGGYDVTIIKSAADTNGDYLLVQVEMEPKGGNGLHYHTTFEEEFEVLEGTLSIQLGKQRIQLLPGDKAVAPKHVLHRFYNEDACRKCVFLVTVKPARQFEATLRIAYGLAHDGLTRANGIPKSFWHTALLFHMGESYTAGLPHRFQIWLAGLLAKEARRRGKHKDLEKYYLPQVTEQLA
ncbi:cupin domain-containing protein [Pontibacter sp. FD36]|uniref:cupin domain-containing protein n=1 Tax=Pontibacter sp. FD36 TaxID=2789860 RepID=UPI0018A95371|nr:cupin domain-containing protein [Pontibacter sp. FD36]MBF8962467.1 cupin domain-containing protein [Pontibacter sp. FD36]